MVDRSEENFRVSGGTPSSKVYLILALTWEADLPDELGLTGVEVGALTRVGKLCGVRVGVGWRIGRLADTSVGVSGGTVTESSVKAYEISVGCGDRKENKSAMLILALFKASIPPIRSRISPADTDQVISFFTH